MTNNPFNEFADYSVEDQFIESFDVSAEGIIDSIKSGLNKIYEAIKSFIMKIYNWFKSFFTKQDTKADEANVASVKSKVAGLSGSADLPALPPPPVDPSVIVQEVTSVEKATQSVINLGKTTDFKAVSLKYYLGLKRAAEKMNMQVHLDAGKVKKIIKPAVPLAKIMALPYLSMPAKYTDALNQKKAAIAAGIKLSAANKAYQFAESKRAEMMAELKDAAGKPPEVIKAIKAKYTTVIKMVQAGVKVMTGGITALRNDVVTSSAFMNSVVSAVVRNK